MEAGSKNLHSPAGQAESHANEPLPRSDLLRRIPIFRDCRDVPALCIFAVETSIWPLHGPDSQRLKLQFTFPADTLLIKNIALVFCQYVGSTIRTLREICLQRLKEFPPCLSPLPRICVPVDVTTGRTLGCIVTDTATTSTAFGFHVYHPLCAKGGCHLYPSC